jgi:hypothetical protein
MCTRTVLSNLRLTCSRQNLEIFGFQFRTRNPKKARPGNKLSLNLTKMGSRMLPPQKRRVVFDNFCESIFNSAFFRFKTKIDIFSKFRPNVVHILLVPHYSFPFDTLFLLDLSSFWFKTTTTPS